MSTRSQARSPAPDADVLVLGGGPAGATAALYAARHGLRAVVLEQGRHPRFHVGESFLPRGMALIEELGLTERLAALPQTRKLGGSFMLGSESEPHHFDFADGLLDEPPDAFNIERAPFDAMLIDAAREAGARVIEGATVRRIERLADGAVTLGIEYRDGGEGPSELHGGWLLDASGQATVVGRHLGTRRTLPDLEKVAYFGHFDNVARAQGRQGGFPLIVMCAEGWFWFIPLDERRTSVGLVMDAALARRTGVPARGMLRWAAERCPPVSERMREVCWGDGNGVTADFSYTCRPYAGDGYFLIGDAATFVDPIFSTGVCLGMMSAVHAVDRVRELLAGTTTPRAARAAHERYIGGSSSAFFRMVRASYRHTFREMFLHERGPLGVHRALISLLCGHVFPRPVWSVRWRTAMFHAFVRLHAVLPLVVRREPFSLLAAAPAATSGSGATLAGSGAARGG